MIQIRMLLALMIACISINVRAQDPGISSVSSNLTLYSTAIGSHAGGHSIYIKGTNFVNDPNLIKILIGPYPCIPSYSNRFFIQCQTTKATFIPQSVSFLPVQLWIKGKKYTSCSSSSCQYFYRSGYTPILQQLFPITLFPGDLLNIFAIHQFNIIGDGITPSISGINHILIGNNSCSLFNIEQYEIPVSYYTDNVICSIDPRMKPGEYNFTYNTIYGYPNITEYVSLLSLFTFQTYMIRVVYHIDSVSNSRIGSQGGNLILKGSFFGIVQKDLRCSLVGYECLIVEANENQITIQIPPLSQINNSQVPSSNSNQSSSSLYPGVYGFNYSRYSSSGVIYNDLSDIAYRKKNNTYKLIESKIVTQLSTPELYSYNYIEYFKGFIYIPVEGEYSYQIVCDDGCIVFQSNITNNSDFANLQKILYTSAWTPSHSNPYTRSNQKIQYSCIYNQSGYYYTEIYTLNNVGLGVFRLSFSIPQPQEIMQKFNATPEQINDTSKITPIYKIQTYNISLSNVQPEIMVINVNRQQLQQINVTSFYFTMMVGNGSSASQEQSGMIQVGDSASSFGSKMNFISIIFKYGPSYSLTMKDTNGNIVTNVSLAVVFEYRITFYLSRSLADQVPLIPSTSQGVSFHVVQVHSSQISGTYSILVNGTALKVGGTSILPFNTSASAIENALNIFYNSTQIVVGQVQISQVVDQIIYSINYIGINQPLPLELDISGLTGGVDSNFQPSVVINRNYSNERMYYDVIPLEFLRTAQENFTFELKFNNLPIICGECSFYYNVELTPVLTFLRYFDIRYLQIGINDISNATISDVSIFLAGLQCSILSGNINNFTCQLDNIDGNIIAQAGTIYPQIHVAGIGFVDTSQVDSVTIPFTILSVIPNQSDIRGGFANISSYGFPKDKEKLIVTICGVNVSDFQYLNQTMLSITVPSSSVVGCPLQSSISFDNQSASFSFNYFSSSIQLNSLSPTILNPFVPQSFVMTGSSFVISNLTTQINLIASDKQKLQLQVKSINNTYVQCLWKGGKPGSYYVEFKNDENGIIFPLLSVQVGIIVANVWPSVGSLGGGYSLFIQGTNFLLQNQTLVRIGKEGVCQIVFMNGTFIQCKVPMIIDENLANEDLEVVVFTRGVIQSTCFGNCTFAYDYNLTDFVNPFDNSTFLAGQTACIVLNSSYVEELYIDKTSYPFSLVNNSACFEYPALTYGYHPVKLKNNNSFLYPEIMTFTPITVNTTLSVSFGSLAGGFTNISGNGFSQFINQSLTRFTMTCGTNVTLLHHVLFTPTIVTLLLPPQKAKTCTITYYWGQNNSKYSYTYQTAKTPKIRYSQSNNFSYSLTKVSMTTINYNSVFFVLLDEYGIQTGIKYQMVLYNSSSTVFQVTPKDSYLAAGGYNIYAYAKDYGFASITNTNSTLLQPFLTNLTSETIISSFNGGSIYTIKGSGFIESINHNKILVCGFRSKIITSNRDNISIEIPPFVTKSTIQAFQLGKQETIKGTWFADTPDNLQTIETYMKTSIYTSSQNECYIGIDTGQKVQAWVKKIIYKTNIAWSSAAQKLIGAVFQVSTDFMTWETLFQVDTSLVHTGQNYWLNQNTTVTSARYIRFRHNSSSMCSLGNLEIIGVIIKEDSYLSDVTCDVDIITYNSTRTIPNAVVYTANQTAAVDSIYPTYGSVEGGTQIHIVGSLFYSNLTVFIDEVFCTIINSTSTEIYCLTGPRAQFSKPNSFEVISKGSRAILYCQPFLYITKWSSFSSWLGQIPPIDMENVVIEEGTNLLIDQSTAVINNLTVTKGKVIIEDKSVTVRAKQIIIKEGEFRVGSKEDPIMNDLTIQFHGDNSGILCQNCKFSVFGIAHQESWVELSQDIVPNDTIIQLSKPVDWQIGQEVVIASTQFDFEKAQKRLITSIDPGNTTIYVDSPFSYGHFGSMVNYENDTLNMRAEVGLLSRNVKIIGIHSSSGPSIFINGTKEEGLKIQGSSFQLGNCGSQGKSCITVHSFGDMNGSFFQRLSIHDTYSRMLTMEGVDYLRVEGLVGFNISGNGISLVSGSQSNNRITRNIIISTYNNYLFPFLDSYSASFFISHPYNVIEGNRAAGGQFYGFLFLFPDYSQRSSMIPDLCPSGAAVLSIQSNTAHSYAQFGFRLFRLASRKYPCLPMQNQSLLDPYSQNPSIENKLVNLVSFKNQIGFLGQQLGNLKMINFILSDNNIGIQIHKTNFSSESVIIKDSVIIGQSSNIQIQTPSIFQASTGLITARTDGLAIQGIHFYNFGPSSKVIQSCSKCQNGSYLVSGGRTTTFKEVLLFNITGNYVKWNYPLTEIFDDLDGSLTKPIQQMLGLPSQANAAISAYRSILVDNSSCLRINQNGWNSTIFCVQNNTIRSILFANFLPKIYDIIKIKRLNDPYQNFTNQSRLSSYSILSQFDALLSDDIPYTWCLPFLTGRYYSVYWGVGIDFTHINVGLNRHWGQNDSLVLRFNATVPREAYLVRKYYMKQFFVTPLQKGSLISPLSCKNGQFFFDSFNQYLFVCVSGKNKQMREWLDVNISKCYNFCPYMLKPGMETSLRYWSDTTQWPNQTLPAAGDNVTIPFEWSVLLDIDPPDIYYLQINGNLIFDRTRNNSLRAHVIWVNLGTIWIGSFQVPFINNAKIVLLGNESQPEMQLKDNIQGRKMLLVTGGLMFYGINRTVYWSYLTSTATANSTILNVTSAQDWVIGDLIMVTQTSKGQNQSEIVEIASINGSIITITQPLLYEHYGSPVLTLTNNFGSIDRRSIVSVLSRNIKIMSGTQTSYAARIVLSAYLVKPIDAPNLSNIVQSGFSNMYNVEIGDFGSDLYPVLHITDQFAFNTPFNSSTFFGMSIYNCGSKCLQVDNSGNISITQSIFGYSFNCSVQVSKVTYFSFVNNLIVSTGFASAYNHTYPLQNSGSIFIRDNIGICGGNGVGFSLPYVDCTSTLQPFSSNTAGMCNIGFQLKGNALYDCVTASAFSAFGNVIAIYSHLTQANVQVVFSNIFLVDNTINLAGNFPTISFLNSYTIRNSYFSAITINTYIKFYYESTSDCYISGMFDFTNSLQPFNITLQNLFDFLPGYGLLNLVNSVVQNYNSSLLPYCSNISVFRSGTSMISIYLTNVTRINSPNSNVLSSDYTDSSIASPSIIQDNDGVFSGQTGILTTLDYWAQNQKCSLIDSSYYVCQNISIAILEFESISPDFLNKTLSPIYFNQKQSNITFECFLSKFNSSMSGELQIFNRFSISLLPNISYDIIYTSPPIDCLYQIQKIEGKSFWLQLSIQYSSYKYASIYVTNDSGIDILVKPITVISKVPVDLASQSMACGTNAFYYQQGKIEIILNDVNGCQVRIVQTSYLTVSAVTDSTLQDFQQETFLEDFANYLDISQRRLRLVDLRSSSLQITLFIVTDAVNKNSSFQGVNTMEERKQLQKISQKLNNMSQNQTFLGAGQILSLSSNIVTVDIIKTQDNKLDNLQSNKGLAFFIFLILMILFILGVMICRNRMKVYPVNRFQQISDESIREEVSGMSSVHPLQYQSKDNG